MAKQIQIWVSEEFKKLLQKEAIDEGCTVVEFTRRIVNSSNTSENFKRKIGGKKFVFPKF